MISYFIQQNYKSKKRHENYKTLNTRLDSVDTIANIGARSVSLTLSIIGLDLIVLPILARNSSVYH